MILQENQNIEQSLQENSSFAISNNVVPSLVSPSADQQQPGIDELNPSTPATSTTPSTSSGPSSASSSRSTTPAVTGRTHPGSDFTFVCIEFNLFIFQPSDSSILVE